MINQWLPAYQSEINSNITIFFHERYNPQEEIETTYEEALRYAVEGGGKRLRPILALLGYEYIAKVKSDRILSYIIGLEFIHCFTLVHDDLPCIDNDEYRRGKLTVWKKYGETMAILVGDSLQTMGFEILASSGNIEVIREMALALGDHGVARGQVRDTFLRHDTLSLAELTRLHDEKTGSFIASSLVVGALLAGGNTEEIMTLRKFGILLGRAFQVSDDILDYEGDSKLVGKKTGKDVELGKGIVALVGIEKSRDILSGLEQEMNTMLEGMENEKFSDIVEYIVKRQH